MKPAPHQISVYFGMGRRREHVDLVHEDRISNLPDDVILRILSLLDMKYVIQTSALSKKWKYIWTSVTHLNFDSYKFRTMSLFTKFVKHALSNRNNRTHVSAVELRFKGPATQSVIESIVNYAYLHNVEQLSFIWFTSKKQEFPLYLFKCHTLKRLTLAVYDRSWVYGICHLPESPWDFPALETLNLRNIRLDKFRDKTVNLFSKCVNLKELVLDGLWLVSLEKFNICAPQLSSLTITHAFHSPKVFNVAAPQLKNLTASLTTSDYKGLCTEGFDSLENVNLSTYSSDYERDFPAVLELFQKLRNAKFLILDLNFIKILSSCMDQLAHEPSPFNNLKCLRIDATNVKEKNIPTMPIQVKHYLLENSPDAAFIMDLPPQVPHKRLRQQVHHETTTNKMIKLDSENKQPENLNEEKRMLEAKIQMQDEVIAQQKTKIQILSDVIAEQKAKIEVLESAKVASSSNVARTRSKRAVQPSESSR